MRVYENKQINKIESQILLKRPQQIISHCHKEKHRYCNGCFQRCELHLWCTQCSWSGTPIWQGEGVSGRYKHTVLK